MTSPKNLGRAYQLAKERYAALGVDTDRALRRLKNVSISRGMSFGRGRCVGQHVVDFPPVDARRRAGGFLRFLHLLSLL